MRFLLLIVLILPSVCFAMPKYKLIAFDAFPIFDPRPVFKKVKEMFPEKGDEINQTWRTRQFEYTWLRASAGKYKDFYSTTEDALVFAANTSGVKLNNNQRTEIMKSYLKLKPWPEVSKCLKQLKSAGYKLAFLSNFTEKMLESSIKHSNLNGVFDKILSTDAIKTFKPTKSAYELAMTSFGIKQDEVLFVPFAAWDMAGAKWFGYKTFWINRINMPEEQLDTKADGVGNSLEDLLKFVGVDRPK